MILYITRKFPPSVGGMQRFNIKLYTHLRAITCVTLISWGGSQAFLPFFLLFAFLRSLYFCLTRQISCIYVSDGLLSPLGLLLKALTGKPVLCNIHGRDIAFEFRPYQIVVPWCLRRMDQVICVSQALKKECLKREVPEAIIHVIPNGVDLDDFKQETGGREAIVKLIGASLEGKKVLLTVGRLVPKKGVDVFIRDILPKIIEKDPRAIYLVAGDGPLTEKIKALVKKGSLGDHVFLLGKMSMDNGLLPALYHLADVFVMPNVPVADDMEGFGIVALEAGASGLPVVASKVDGITEAVKNGENGFLIGHDDRQRFADKVLELLKDETRCKQLGQQAQDFVGEHYTWIAIARRYCAQFQKISQKRDGPHV